MKRLSVALMVAAIVVGAATIVWAAQSRNKVGGGYIIYPAGEKSPGPALFSHLAHGISGAGFKCAACHGATAKKRWALSYEAVHEGNACAVCHNGKTKGPKSGKRAAKIDDCQSCHMPAKDTLIRVESIGSIPFSHTRHTGAIVNNKIVEYGGQSCGACHPDLYAAKAGLSMAMTYPHGTDSCGTCHNDEAQSPSGKVVFTAHGNCASCHKKDSSVLSGEK